MIRLFVAVELPADIRARLARLRRPLPRASWVAESRLHLSLRFIGEIDEGRAADCDEALARIDLPAFEIGLAGVDQFNSSGRVRSLWAGVEPSPPLTALHGKVESALRRAGLPPEGRRFMPHVTLARLRDAPLERVAPFLASHSRFRAGPIPVNRFVLFSSLLRREGPIYTPERVYPLAGGDFAELAAEWEASD